MSSTITTHFETMGSNPLVGTVVNVSGDRSPYTIPTARKGPSSDVLATGGKANKGATLMSGTHNGAKFSPQTKICFPNAPEASATGRGMRTVPKAGNSFASARRSTNSDDVVIR